MNTLLEMVSKQLQGDNLSKMSRQIGADESATQGALSAAVPLLISALSRNASGREGADALAGALARDHDGSILDNLSGFLDNPDTTAGDGILGHILGAKRGMIENGLSRSGGLSAGSVGKMLSMLAPVLMGALGKTQRQGKMDSQSLSGYLGRQREEMERNEPQAMGLFGSLLDADRDGDVDAGDLIKHGLNLFGKFMKGR